jgi:hypothetical protein
MSKSLSVKVPTKKVVSALEATLAKKQADYENQDKAKALYEKEVDKYNLALIKLIKAGKGTITSANKYHWQSGSKSGNITVSAEIVFPKSALPVEPKEPTEVAEWRYKSEIEEITQAIRVLKMSDQEYVNASTMKSVSQYL